MNGEIFDIIDEQDNVIGKATRKEAHEKHLLHRVVHVLIENKAGKILCLKRGINVDIRPGMISNCAEHVKANESYETAAKRAPQEELGVNLDVEFKSKVIQDEPNHCTIIGCFKAKSEGPFTIDRSELDGAEFKSLEEIRKEISEGIKYSPAFQKVLGELYG